MVKKLLVFASVFLISLIILFILPQNITSFVIKTEKPLSYSSAEIDSPADRITSRDIEIQDNKIIIHINNPQLSRYANTNSMDPILDEKANGIEIIPEGEEDIYVGDIVTYEQDNMLVVHRVIEIGNDEQGTYYIVKGDNNNEPDSKIRFEQIKYITIGILY